MTESFNPYPTKEWQKVLQRVANLNGWEFEGNSFSIVFPNDLTYGLDYTGGRDGIYIEPVNAAVVRGRAKCIAQLPHRRFSRCEINDPTCLNCNYRHLGCPLKQRFFPDK